MAIEIAEPHKHRIYVKPLCVGCVSAA